MEQKQLYVQDAQMDHNPHTGSMSYVDSIPKIPAAAISSKDAISLAMP